MLSGREVGGAEDPVGTEQVQRSAVNSGGPAVRVINLTEYGRSGRGRAVMIMEFVRGVGGHPDEVCGQAIGRQLSRTFNKVLRKTLNRLFSRLLDGTAYGISCGCLGKTSAGRGEVRSDDSGAS